MNLYNGDIKNICNDERFFCFNFRVLFEGACEYSYEELIERAIKDYGSLRKFFETVEVYQNTYFGRMELECKYGNGWLGFMFDDHGGLFSYIEDSNYELIDVWPSGFHEFTMKVAIPKKYHKNYKR